MSMVPLSSESESKFPFGTIEKRGNPFPRGETDRTAFLLGVARLRWPRKTALHWGAAAGVGERMAKYWLSRKHAVSAAGRLALIREMQ